MIGKYECKMSEALSPILLKDNDTGEYPVREIIVDSVVSFRDVGGWLILLEAYVPYAIQ